MQKIITKAQKVSVQVEMCWAILIEMDLYIATSGSVHSKNVTEGTQYATTALGRRHIT